jgi:hypothetical protein
MKDENHPLVFFPPRRADPTLKKGSRPPPPIREPAALYILKANRFKAPRVALSLITTPKGNVLGAKGTIWRDLIIQIGIFQKRDDEIIVERRVGRAPLTTHAQSSFFIQ